jgi:hypothetical protein
LGTVRITRAFAIPASPRHWPGALLFRYKICTCKYCISEPDVDNAKNPRTGLSSRNNYSPPLLADQCQPNPGHFMQSKQNASKETTHSRQPLTRPWDNGNMAFDF